jgi:hypothetical protein
MAEDTENFDQDTPESAGFSPKESVGHKLLLDAAEENGIDRNRVRQLLWLLNAPPDIDGIAAVLTNLVEVLEAAEEQWPDILDLQNLKWVHDLIETLHNVIKKLPSLQTSTQHGGRDWLERNALYCAIRTKFTLPPEYQAQYRLLQAHYFFAHTAWLERNVRNPATPTDITDYESYGEANVWPALRVDPYHAGLCIRDMAKANYWGWTREFLDKLPVKETPRQLLAHASVEMKTEIQEFLVQKKVNYLSDYLRQIYGIKDRVRGHGSPPGPRHSSEIGDPEDPWLNFGTLSDWETAHDSIPEVPPLVLPPPDTMAPAPPSSEPITNLAPPGTSAESDVDANDDNQVLGDEYEGEEETESFAGSLDCEEPAYEESPGSFSGRSEGAVNQIIRKQKMFSFAIERLGARELRPLGRGCQLLIFELLDFAQRKIPLNKHPERRPGDSQLRALAEVEALLFLLIMLWTGSDAERTASLIVARNESFLRNEPLAIVCDSRSWPSVGVIRIRVPFPKYRSEQTPMPNSDCRRTEYIYLPDEMNLSAAIRHYAGMRKLGAERYQPFPGGPERYQTNARLLLRAWDPSGRLTLNKIASALFERVMSLTGDDAVAATMITGNRHRLSNVAMHYACRELSVIQDVYRRTVLRHGGEIDREGPRSWRFPSDVSDPSPAHLQLRRKYMGKRPDAACVGRRLCPRTDRFQQAFHNLIEVLSNKPYAPGSDQVWIAFHNQYTFYTVWMFALATGVRKMVTPYLDVREVSPINGVAKLRDKDGDSGIKAKLVWIPDLVVKQMQHYADHLEFIHERFGIAAVDLPCFFLSEEGRIKQVRPKTMGPYVSTYLPGFPIDIHRRFMFNALLDFGCPPEVVRIWMGHAIAGEEWWRDDATFSHQEYRQHLCEFLVPILDYLELKPVKGLASRKRVRQEEMVYA